MGISQFIKDKAMELGFSACGIAEVAKAGSEEAYFDQWIAEGYHAGMKYMENHREIVSIRMAWWKVPNQLSQ